MKRSEIVRLLSMIAHEDVNPDAFEFVVKRFQGAFSSVESDSGDPRPVQYDNSCGIINASDTKEYNK
tara:strand:- start:1074 stop:1274 length:201 start_codon:yes stop_codon:yes gene_type:complete